MGDEQTDLAAAQARAYGSALVDQFRQRQKPAAIATATHDIDVHLTCACSQIDDLAQRENAGPFLFIAAF
ncbi:MAG: hypothetical protein ACJ8AI_03780 [Rhodopila sp.]